VSFQFDERAFNLVQDRANILIQFLVPEADHVEATRGEPSGAPLVVFDGFRIQMLRAIEFNDEFDREGSEVNYVRADRGLSAEFVAAEFVGTQEMPKTFFRIGGFVAERAGEVALLIIAVHGFDFPPPNPTPPRGGDRTTFLS
jgi:hypothetical protein